MPTHYIFGYGSLICQDSRSRTGITSDASPVEVQGIQRRWSMHSPEWPATAVSAHDSPKHRCNGVYFAVDADNLKNFDRREQGYQRIQLPWSQVNPLSEQSLPSDGTLWAYVGNDTGEPSTARPIMQSYLDVILNGCLNFGVDFTQRFTETTELWQCLVDDRHDPQYPRPLNRSERLPDIDRILATHLPDLLEQRQSYSEQ